MVDTLFGRIVNPDSADPGLPDCKPTPIRENHITIAKPWRRDELVYDETRSFISKVESEPAAVGELREYQLEPFKIDWSWQQFVPKLVRGAVVGLFAVALWHGLPLLSSTISMIFRTHEEVGEVSNQIKELSRQVAEFQASRAPQPVAPEQIDRKAKEIEPAIHTALTGRNCASKPAGAICAVFLGGGRMTCDGNGRCTVLER
jgi:hypothetical protein